MSEPWELLVRQGAEALLGGRFRECERLIQEAADLAPDEAAPALLGVTVCREQGRAAEAEILLRQVLHDHPGSEEGRALLGAVLADLGRDAEARRQLDLLDFDRADPVVAAPVAEVAAALESPRHAEAVPGALARDVGGFAGCHGSVSRHLGLVCQVLGRWDEAEAHFRTALEVNRAAGAPVLVAHTRRHYSALLRARGGEGDWEHAIDLLAGAAAIYRRLEIDRLAEEAELVLRRSQDPATVDEDGPSPNVFRRTAVGWELGYGGRRAVVPDVDGLGHIAVLLSAEGRPVYAVDLIVTGPEADAGDRVAAEYRSRLTTLDGQETADADPVAVALARAERDRLDAELGVLAAGASTPGELGDLARRLVALRVRTALDRIEAVLPALARHLRRSIRTGTFCLYEPAGPQRWKMGP